MQDTASCLSSVQFLTSQRPCQMASCFECLDNGPWQMYFWRLVFFVFAWSITIHGLIMDRGNMNWLGLSSRPKENILKLRKQAQMDKTSDVIWL